MLPDKNRILQNFNSCENWEEKYLYIITLGNQIKNFSQSLYNSNNIISGCQSKVWILMTLKSDNTVIFEGDSDAAIVKGLIAVLFSIYQDIKVEDMLNFDVYSWLKKFNLLDHLTSSRTQGMLSIIKKIKLNSQLLLNKT